MGLSIGVYTRANGPMLADWTRLARGAQFGTNEHGYDTFSATILMNRRDAARWLRRRGTPHIAVTERSGVGVWEGRLEDVAIEAEGIRIVAYGYWRAYSDVVYTSLWTKTDFEDFEALNVDNHADANPGVYEMDANSRIYIAPKKGDDFGSANSALGVFGYETPHLGAKQIVQVAFDYSFKGDANWNVALQRWSGAGTPTWTFVASDWSLSGNGAVQAGTVTQTLGAGTDRIAFRIYRNAATATYTLETGNYYFKITGIRITTSIVAATVNPDEVVKAMITYVNAYNGSSIASSATSGVQANTFALNSALWEDTTPADIIDELAARGDAAGRRWEAKVWENRALRFHPAGTNGDVYFVDNGDVELNRSTEMMYNAAYATYKGNTQNNRTLRTAVGTDPGSIAANRLTRLQTVDADTTNSTEATSVRDNAIANSKALTPRANISFRRVYDQSGTIIPLYRLRAGDLVIVRGGNTAIEKDYAKFSQILLGRTMFDVDNRRISVEPADPAATLVALLGGTY